MPEQTTHKIEELKFKLKNDPKSRLFYPLAEELRKIGRFGDAELYLRAGLAHHPSYLSAWVSLGRVLLETSKNEEAVVALKQALTVDPGNMVAAKLLAETYYDLGDKVEAIKKYKLVHALLPADDEISAKIEQLNRELNPPRIAVVDAPPSIVEQPKRAVVEPHLPSPVEEMTAWDAVGESANQAIEDDTFAPEPDPAPEADRRESSQPHEDLFDGAEEAPLPAVTMEPTMGGGGVLQSAVDVDHRQAMSLFEFRPAAEESFEDIPNSNESKSSKPSPFDWTEPESGDQQPAAQRAFSGAPESPSDDSGAIYSLSDSADQGGMAPDGDVAGEDDEVTATSTMADLYAQQGHLDSAREIYERLLDKDPHNQGLKKRLAELPHHGAMHAPQKVAVERLQGWLRRIKDGTGRV